jgi:hypothetical protein
MSRDITKYPALQNWLSHAEQLTAECNELKNLTSTPAPTMDYRALEQTLHAKVAVIKGLASQTADLLDKARVDQLRVWQSDLQQS